MLKGKQGWGGRMGGLEVEGMRQGGYTGPWLNSKSRFRFSFLKKRGLECKTIPDYPDT